jgi:iron complex outermembrane receptor protein
MKKIYKIIVPVLFVGNFVFSQQIVKGNIKDIKGKVVPGAVINVKGTNVVVVSDSVGYFTLNTNEPLPLWLQIDSKGFLSEQLKLTQLPAAPLQILLSAEVNLGEVVVTSRRREEKAQDIPIPITVIGGQRAEDAGAFNVNRLKELVPSVQLYSSNARNTTLNIRGLGSTFGLTNDGIDPGVGFYIDGVYHARPAATALDFVDIDQIEILRGPQGTLFGKNTTAGAFNITSKKPSETPGAKVELSYGNYNFTQAKASVTGKVAKNLSTRISFSGTQRSGTIFNENDQQRYNGLNNIGVKGQLYWTPSEKLSFQLIGDYNNQQPDGSSLVVAGITTTKRNAYRQYDAIIKDLGYERPVIDPFARKIYTNTPYRHDQDLGGVSLNGEYKIGKGTLTSTSAWRFWNWDPVNDRDFTQIAALTKSQAPSHHEQFSQELRYSGNILKKLSGVVGVYYLNQKLTASPYHEEEVGPDQWRFQASDKVKDSLLIKIENRDLLNGYGIRTYSTLKTQSSAAYGQLDWDVFKGLHVIGGLRFNYDKKDLDYRRETYGGRQTSDAKLLAIKNAVYSNQVFTANTENTNLSGNLTLAYKLNDKFNTYATYSTAYKPVGVNLGGLPTVKDPVSGKDVADLSLSVIKPEFVQHVELGVKTRLLEGLILNVSAYNTDIKDYQTNVQSPQLGVNRGYLANAEKVNVKGFEIDANYRLKKFLSLNASVSYTDGKYVKFTNAPLPLEETGATTIDPITNKAVQQAFKDISGSELPGISKWNVALGGELSTAGKLFENEGRFFIATDFSHRSAFSSNPSPSTVLRVNAYSIVNARLGFKSGQYSVFIWSRNLANTNYFEQLQAAAGNSGLYAGVLGDPRTYGATFRFNF